MTQLTEEKIANFTESAIAETETQESAIIMPFEYGEDEHYYVEQLGQIKKKPFYSFLKRTFDIVASLIGLIVAAIPMLIIAILIKLSSKGIESGKASLKTFYENAILQIWKYL